MPHPSLKVLIRPPPLACRYQNADHWYRNLDKLIHYVNLNGSVNAFYSTPARYTDEKKKWKGSYEVGPVLPMACYTPLSLVLHTP